MTVPDRNRLSAVTTRGAFPIHFLREFGGRAIDREIWWAEFWSCLGALAWGVLLRLYAQELRGYPSLWLVLEMWPVDSWAILSICLSLLQLTALLLNRKELRWGRCLLLCSLWGVLTSGVWAALPPLAVPYGVLCGINMYSVLRLPFKR
jgi:hypothetical protein